MNTLNVIITSALMTTIAAAAGKIAPPAAVGLRVVPQGFHISWRKSADDPVKVTGYEVVRSGHLSGPFITVCQVPRGTTECVDANAMPEHIYFYKVRALSKENKSPFSLEATGEIPGIPGLRR